MGSRSTVGGRIIVRHALDQGRNFIKWNTLVSEGLDQHNLLLHRRV